MCVLLKLGCNSEYHPAIELVSQAKLEQLDFDISQLECLRVDKVTLFKVTNVFDQKLLIIKDTEEGKDCFFWEQRKKYIYSAKKDSLLFRSISIGDSFAPPDYDTLTPGESRYLIEDEDALVNSVSFGEKVLFLQYTCPVLLLGEQNQQQNRISLHVLIKHDKSTGEISQMPFIVPDSLADFRIL